MEDAGKRMSSAEHGANGNVRGGSLGWDDVQRRPSAAESEGSVDVQSKSSSDQLAMGESRMSEDGDSDVGSDVTERADEDRLSRSIGEEVGKGLEVQEPSDLDRELQSLRDDELVELERELKELEAKAARRKKDKSIEQDSDETVEEFEQEPAPKEPAVEQPTLDTPSQAESKLEVPQFEEVDSDSDYGEVEVANGTPSAPTQSSLADELNQDDSDDDSGAGIETEAHSSSPRQSLEKPLHSPSLHTTLEGTDEKMQENNAPTSSPDAQDEATSERDSLTQSTEKPEFAPEKTVERVVEVQAQQNGIPQSPSIVLSGPASARQSTEEPEIAPQTVTEVMGEKTQDSEVPASPPTAQAGNEEEMPSPRQSMDKPEAVKSSTEETDENAQIEDRRPSPMSTQGEWTTSPEGSAPVSPITPNEKHLSKSSMASIPLSETDLDYDHLSAENVDELLATPRASRARHMRKPSSLEILQNQWEPARQSTLFDFNKTTPPITPSSPGDDMGARQSVHFAAAEAIPIKSPSSTASITSIGRNSSRTASETDSNATPKRLSSSDDDEPNEVDWRQLERNEQQEKTDKELPEGAEDESTAFLLARLEQENAALTSNPKAATHSSATRVRSKSRPPSMAQLRKLVSKGDAPSIRYSLAPDMPLPEEPPPMTELEFWAALVQDYPSTAARLPTLTTSKIRSGIPLPLRGIVWTSMSGARDKNLEEAFDKLVGEQSPYEGIINKDVGRSFPGVELFRDAGGDGQRMLGRVLKCFSLYDKDIGYCQGLGFLVGPLLMNMGEREAFCVLVRLMDHYSLQPSFLPSLSGLHMRIYQFSALLKQMFPALSDHLVNMGVEPAYLSQWFLSCFAVTCPLPMLFRIYDVIFAEGANETVMRVALALMRRSEQKLLESTEFEEVMQLLLGRQLWDSYNMNPDELVDDFTSLDDVITHTRLAELEKEFESQSGEAVGEKAGFLPDVQAAASRFLGRLWAPSHSSTKSTSTLSPPSAEKEPRGFLRRSASKQSISTLAESQDGGVSSGSASLASTAPTEVDNVDSRESRAETVSLRSKAESTRTASVAHTVGGVRQEDRDLHGQIEDLLMALGELQRDHANLVGRLQRECEERGEDQRAVKMLVENLTHKDGEEGTTVEERRRTLPPPPRNAQHSRQLSTPQTSTTNAGGELEELLGKVTERLHTSPRISASFETKAALRDKLSATRHQLASEETRNRDLTTRLEHADQTIAAHYAEGEDLRSEVAELRTRVNEEFKERQKLEHTVRELQAQARAVERKERLVRAETMDSVPTLSRTDTSDSEARRVSVASMPPSAGAGAGGLRELKLGRRESSSSVQSMRTFRGAPGTPSPPRTSAESPTATTPTATPTSAPNALTPGPPNGAATFHPRGSSLATQAVLATPAHEPAHEEALLLELVNAKTAEAQARQEVDELKRNLAVQRRKQEEALRVAMAEAEVAKAEVEAFRSVEVARVEAKARADERARSVMSDHEGEEGGVVPRVETPREEISVSKTPGSSKGGSPATTPAVEKGGGGGWFWSRRTASTNAAKVGTP